VPPTFPLFPEALVVVLLLVWPQAAATMLAAIKKISHLERFIVTLPPA
jgi:hypothetical protein